MADLTIPLLLIAVSAFALAKKQNVYADLTDGAQEGIRVLARVAPSLIILLTAVQLFRVSGAMAILCDFFAPLFSFLGIPPEVAPLVFVRPLSGSAALAVGADLMKTYGVDSVIGKTAAVMLGSTETTFYTISVYFGAAKIKRTRYAVAAALIADFIGFVASAFAVRWML